MKKILTVIGARPQFIKAAAVSRKILTSDGLEECIVHTGQHFDENMSEIFFREMEIPKPKHLLSISGGSHGQMTGRMLAGIEETLLAEQPDVVMVYGDTNSTLAGALAASKLHIPVVHVEAGLRSFNKLMPEEINRILTDHCSDLLLTPTTRATKNLFKEGFETSMVIQIGDVMLDAALHFGAIAKSRGEQLLTPGISNKSFILATIHRQENTDDRNRLSIIIKALAEFTKSHLVVLPIHPRTKSYLQEYDLIQDAQKLKIVEPMGYLEMVAHERAAALIVTDSGGIQKEAFFHGIPCVTLRDETEWVELVDAGWNVLVPPTSEEAVYIGMQRALGTSGKDISPYGSGNASEKLIAAVLDMFE